MIILTYSTFLHFNTTMEQEKKLRLDIQSTHARHETLSKHWFQIH